MWDSLLTVTGEKLSRDYSAMPGFIEKFKEIIEEPDLSANQVYNVDNSELFWNLLLQNMSVLRKFREDIIITHLQKQQTILKLITKSLNYGLFIF